MHGGFFESEITMYCTISLVFSYSYYVDDESCEGISSSCPQVSHVMTGQDMT
jgi:hypothetical protein